MLPGRFDKAGLFFSALSLAFLICFTAISGFAFVSELQSTAAQKGQSFFGYLWTNFWGVVQGPGAVFAGFFIASLSNAVALWRHFLGLRRETELRRAYGAGIWHGYEVNFLDKVVKSFADKGLPAPRFILASPSYEVLGKLNFGDFVGKQLPAALERAGYEMTSLYGTGDPAWFRQVFRIARVGMPQDDAERPVFFDLPTTFKSFEGAVASVIAQRDVNIPMKKRSAFFDDMKSDFFAEARVWSSLSGAPLAEIQMANAEVTGFAAALARVLEEALLEPTGGAASHSSRPRAH